MENKFPKTELLRGKPTALAALEPLFNCVVPYYSPEPLDGVPLSGSKNTCSDEVAVSGPLQAFKVTIPEQRAQFVRNTLNIRCASMHDIPHKAGD
jgi:hypothetical protein